MSGKKSPAAGAAQAIRWLSDKSLMPDTCFDQTRDGSPPKSRDDVKAAGVQFA
jgi:hypothetical protein